MLKQSSVFPGFGRSAACGDENVTSDSSSDSPMNQHAVSGVGLRASGSDGR